MVHKLRWQHVSYLAQTKHYHVISKDVAHFQSCNSGVNFSSNKQDFTIFHNCGTISQPAVITMH